MAPEVARAVTVWAALPVNAATISTWAKLALESARARRSAEGARNAPVPLPKPGSGHEPVTAAEAVAQQESWPRKRGGAVHLRGRLCAGHCQGRPRRHLPGRVPVERQAPNTFGWTVSKARTKEEFDAIERILGCGVRDHLRSGEVPL